MDKEIKELHYIVTNKGSINSDEMVLIAIHKVSYRYIYWILIVDLHPTRIGV